jgi:hypothetical protein
MEHYVTLFNKLFLPQGLALHSSLERHAGSYTLWILCVDETTYDVLGRLNLPNIRLILLSAVETPDLVRVRKERTIGEYCWTLTPFAPRFVFEADSSVSRVTYLDADLFLLRSPSPVFQELERSGKQVLITDHAYAPEHDQSALSGRYCVQFMAFYRGKSEVARKWWEDRCIEWCFNRVEDGKFGDQKYLHDWPERYPDLVHVAKEDGQFLAPWNATRFPYSKSVVFHFHGLRLLAGEKVLLTEKYALPDALVQHIYGPYLAALKYQVKALATIGFKADPQDSIGLLRLAKGWFRGALRQSWLLKTLRVGNFPD